MVKPLDPQELIEAAKTGDRQAFETLGLQERTRIRALVASRLNAHIVFGVAVDDVYQETLLRAYESIVAFKYKGKDSLLHWMGGIAENVILHLGRKRARERRTVFDEDVPARDVSPSRTLRREERFHRLEDALEKLSPEHREVIMLLRIKGFTIGQTAEQMGRSRDAVKKLLYRALKQLKSLFGDTESFHLPGRAFGRSENEGRE
jgi:RNA polymerase sigma-70 factor, ECF subfamily